MDNRFKETYDRASMLKDISDREQMINNFRRTGYLDRDKEHGFRLVQPRFHRCRIRGS